jgi:hypothetical protein
MLVRRKKKRWDFFKQKSTILKEIIVQLEDATTKRSRKGKLVEIMKTIKVNLFKKKKKHGSIRMNSTSKIRQHPQNTK